MLKAMFATSRQYVRKGFEACQETADFGEFEMAQHLAATEPTGLSALNDTDVLHIHHDWRYARIVIGKSRYNHPMRRSRINEIMEDAEDMIRRHGFTLPPFAYWSPAQFAEKKDAAKNIITSRCGWDITDYGLGDFDRMGLFLFTLRNGRLSDLQNGRGMCYAEKLLISKQDQLSPCHTHAIKVEDIINRGGATLIIELHGSDDQGNFAEDRGGVVWLDGIRHEYAPGEKLRLGPGESVTLWPGDWHAFWGEGGDVLIGEVSTVNDDETDNIFREEIGRFSNIDEDAPPSHLLVSDYRSWLG